MTVSKEQDGRITLDRSLLKALRKQRGLSQEQVALECAERGLYVSIASLKRAETTKNVLYRTARDLASFYQVDVRDLIQQTSKPHAELNHASSQKLDNYHAALLLSIEITLPPNKNAVLSSFVSLSNFLNCQSSNLRVLKSDKNCMQLCFGIHEVTVHLLSNAIELARSLMKESTTLGVDTSILLSECRVLVRHGEQNCHHEINSSCLQHHNDARVKVPNCGAWVDATFRASASQQLALKPSQPNELWEIDFTSRPEQKQCFIGRQTEQIQFRSVLESSLAYQTSQLVLLQGVAGIGKSRLAKHFSELAKNTNHVCVLGQIFDSEVEEENRLLPNLANQLVTHISTTTNTKNTDSITPWENDADSSIDDHSILKGWLDKPLNAEEQLRLDSATPDQLIQYRAKTLAKLISLICEQNPLVVIIEDLHWADSDLLEVIKLTAFYSSELPLIFTLTARPDNEVLHYLARDLQNLPSITLNLGPLKKDEMLEMAEALGSNKDCHLQQCITRSEGNPLFLEHLLTESQRSFQQLPLTIQALILEKIERLPTYDQIAARAASIIGRKFKLDVLQKLVDSENYQPTTLVRSLIISKNHDSLEFCHALIHECIYDSIVSDTRKQFHLKCAFWYQQSDLTLYAHHLIRANHAEATSAAILAAEALLQRQHPQRAIGLLRDALPLATSDIERSKVFRLLGTLKNRLGNNKQAVDYFIQAINCAPEPKLAIEAHLQCADCLNTLDQFDAAIRHLDEAEHLAERIESQSHLAKTFYLRGNFYFPKGNPDVCRKHHQAALNYARQCGDIDLQARALGGLGDAEYAAGKMYSAYEAITKCLALCAQHELMHVKAANLFMLATTQIYQNNSNQALENALTSARLAKNIGHHRAEIVSRLTASWIFTDKLELEAASKQVETALAIVQDVGARRFEPFLLETTARIFLYQNKNNQARSTIDRAVNLMEDLTMHRFIGPWLYGTQALVLAFESHAEQVNSKINDALENGEVLLKKGSIGHNYFRFYWAATETMLQLGNKNRAITYQQALRNYTQDEVTPWSEFYIDRAQLFIDYHEKDRHSMIQKQNLTAKAQLLCRQAAEFGLNTAIQRIESFRSLLNEVS